MEQRNERDLLPCPFCGNLYPYRVKETDGSDPDYTQFYVVCDANEGGCGASSGYYENARDAVAAWNNRTWPLKVPHWPA